MSHPNKSPIDTIHVLDEIFPAVITNLILGCLSLSDFDASHSFSRVFRYERDRFDLPIPHKPFIMSVWVARFHGLESCNGVRLEASRYVSFPTKKIMIWVFAGLQMSNHCQCNSGFIKLLGEGHASTGELNFIRDHWLLDWLPTILTRIDQLTPLEIHRSGIGVVAAAIIKISSDICDNTTNSVTASVIGALINQEKFRVGVWIPGALYFQKFLQNCGGDMQMSLQHHLPN